MPATLPPPPTTSLAARLLNVFATPGEVFEEVRISPVNHANWLVPVLLAAIVGAISAVIIFSQPAILQQIHEQQAKMFDQSVKAGKMTQADADKAVAMAEKFSGPTVLKISGSVAAVFGSCARVFWWALVLWLLGLWFLKVKFSYLKAVEVAGLASMITILGGIVALLLTVNFGKETSPSLALAVNDFNPKNPLHLLFAAANLFSFWTIGVMSVGLARLAGVRFPRAMVLVAGYWLALQFFLISVGAVAGNLVSIK